MGGNSPGPPAAFLEQPVATSPMARATAAVKKALFMVSLRFRSLFGACTREKQSHDPLRRLPVQFAIRHQQMRHDVHVQLAVNAEGQFLAVEAAVQLARRLSALDQIMNELKVASAFVQVTNFRG